MKVDQVIWLFVVAVGLFVCVFAFVLITGQTFGQRCSALGLTLAQFKPALAMNPELQARCATSPPGID